ncbi:MAG TPA: tol-pal system protein YbgF [Thioalkalivibrio sp.]|nr:tol-pal system protein YbgF [Thioalkalivibrio sp.]
MKRTHRIAGLLLGLALLPALASAQQGGAAPDLRHLDARIERLERLMDNQTLMDMMRRLEALEQDVRALRGGTEANAHEIDTLRSRQRDLYLDVDRRLQAVEEGGSSSAPSAPVVTGPDSPAEPVAPPAPSGGNAGNAGNDQQAYRAAFDLLRDGRYEQSIGAFKTFLEDHPQSGLAANAQYWLGEAMYVSRDYEASLAEFDKVLEDHPDSNKVPDALLKMGFSHYELGQWDKAREFLEKVRREHGGGAVARLAEQRLQRMRDEGR